MADPNPFADPNFGKDITPANPFADPNFGKPGGMVSAFGAGVKETVGQAAQAVGSATGLSGAEQWGKEVRANAAPVVPESLAASTARAAGSLVGWLPAIAGTLAAIPEAPEIAGGAALRGMAGMLLPAAANKVTTTADLKDKGVDDATAQKAGWAAAITTAATGAMPLSLTGGLLKRAASGAASSEIVNEVGRQTQNAILSDHPELQHTLTAEDVVSSGVIGAMLGGILGPRPLKTQIAAARGDAESNLANPDNLTTPAPEVKTPEQAATEQAAPERQSSEQAATEQTAPEVKTSEQNQADTQDQWRATKLASDIESTDNRVETARLQQQGTDRQNLMDTIYSDPNERTPGMTFLAALKDEYPNKPEPTPQEKAMMAKRESAYQAFNATPEGLPSTPNELVLPTKEPAVSTPLPGVVGDRARGVNDVLNMWKSVLGDNEGAKSTVQEQHLTDAVEGKATITEQLAGIAALRKKSSTGTDNRMLLAQLSDKLGKFRKEAPNAVPVERSGSVLQHAQEGIGETGSKRQRVEPVQQGAETAPEKGNGPTPQGENVNEGKKTETTQTEPGETQQQEVPTARQWGVEALDKIVADAKAKRPEEAVKEPEINGASERREAYLEKTKEQRELTPTEHRELVALKTDNEEARAWEEAKDRADERNHAPGEPTYEAKTPDQAENPASKADIDTEAAKLFGSKAAADRLIVHVTDPETQIPKRALDALRSLESKEGHSITVAFAHNGKVYVMDNRIEKGTERAIILHEAGVHLGMEKLIGKDNFSKLVAKIKEWGAGNGHAEDIALARKALESVQHNDVPDAQRNQETVAYFVQHAVEAGISPTHVEGQAQTGATQWLRKIWAAMKTALQRLGLDPSALRAQDLVDIAHAAAIAHAEGIPGETKETVDFKYPATARSARAINFQAGPAQAAKAVDVVTSKVASMWDAMKPAIQRAHLNWSQMTHLADMYEGVIPTLSQWGKDAVTPIRDKVNNMLASGAIAKELNHAAQGIYDQMQALGPKQKDALVQLMGKYQLAKVYPNLTAEAHIWLKDKTLYREARQLYSQEGVAAAYDAARLHNQRLHDTGMASMLKSMAQIYGVPEKIWRAVNVRGGMSEEVTTLLDHVAASNDHTLQDQFKSAMALHEAKETESYFSLGRDGDYMVNFHIKDTPEAHAAVQKALSASGTKDDIVVNPGDTHVFSMFETMNQMLTVTKELDKIKQHLEPKMGVDEKGAPTESPYTAGLAIEKLKALDSSAPSFIRGMLAKIDADPHLDNTQKAEQQELLRRMYINMLPESSVSKFYARRAGTPGYSSDMARSFVKRAATGAYFTAQHATRPEQNVAMARLREATTALGDAGSPYFDLRKQASAVNVINELNKRTANQLTPLHTPGIDAASAIGHAFYLSASPGFILQNLAQPYQLTLPYLGGRHGFRASSVAMGVAAQDVAKIIKDTIQQGWQGNKWTGVLDAAITVDRATHLSDGDRAALKYLIASGRADWTQGGQLTHIAEGSNRALETTLKTTNSLAYYGEILNRMQTGLATYRLEMKRSNDTDKAHDRMIQAVDDTQINYATENRARAMGKHGVFGAVTPLVLAFQQYNLGVMQLLGKLTLQATASGLPAAERMEAVKSLAGILAATGVSAGTMGLPFVGIVMGAYNALMGDENHPVDAKTDYQNFLSDIMGHDAAQVVSHGALNYVTGADVASRLGQENLVPFTQLFSQLLDSRQPLKDRINAGALNFMGPVVNGSANVLQGLNKIADGDTMKGLEQMSPAMTKGAFKAVDMANNGFTDSKGIHLPMEATTWDTMVQATGFTPTKLSNQKDAQAGVNSIQSAQKMRQGELSNQFVAAVEAHDVIARQKVMEDARAFMLANPGLKVDFAGALRRRAQETAIARATGGVQSRASQMPMIKQQSRFLQP